jgi:hypothetical protein
MPQSPHIRIAELHYRAAHAHASAAPSHDKGDYLSARELTRKAHEHSMNVSRVVEELSTKKATSTKGHKPNEGYFFKITAQVER